MINISSPDGWRVAEPKALFRLLAAADVITLRFG
jgi:hypothetical protein